MFIAVTKNGPPRAGQHRHPSPVLPRPTRRKKTSTKEQAGKKVGAVGSILSLVVPHGQKLYKAPQIARDICKRKRRFNVAFTPFF